MPTPNKQINKQKILIEGIYPNGDGGTSYSGEFEIDEIVEKVNSLIGSYRKVVVCPNYPYGQNTNIYEPVNNEDIEKLYD